MGDFRQGNRSRGGFGGGRSGGSRFGGSRGGYGRDRDSERRPIEMHDAVCDKCGKNCQVPFRPSGDKPVLCSDCFRESGDSRGSRGNGAQSGISSDQFTKLNAKLDKILAVLESLEIIPDDEEDDLDEEIGLEVESVDENSGEEDTEEGSEKDNSDEDAESDK
jgi:CxxC-x17-CxxC domain-containing protein